MPPAKPKKKPKAAPKRKKVVIVESPSKAKTLNKYLGSEYLVLASKGHLIDLPKSKLGVDLERDFEPQYIPIRGKASIIKELKKAAKDSETVYLATDPDREGEAIGWHIRNFLNKVREDLVLYRLRLNEITQRGVQEALQAPSQVDLNMVNAQQARRVLDRLVGYGISPILWKHIRRGLSAGRVQSVALRLVYDRENEIGAFQPREYWTLEAEFQTNSGQTLRARLFRVGGEKPDLKDEAAVQALTKALSGRSFRVTSVQQRERQKRPPTPFTTSKLQQEAYKQFRFNARKTMSIAQKLYEGVEVGEEGPVGLITYMRTDSRRVSPDAKAEAAKFVKSQFGTDYLGGEDRAASGKMKVQDAHEAIRPTSVFRTPDAMRPFLTPDQHRLYKLIWEDFLASQMSPARFKDTVVEIGGGEAVFRATASVPVFDGYTRIYQEAADEDKPAPGSGTGEGEEGEALGVLPEVAEGEPLSLSGTFPEQHFTQPPPRYTDASMVKTLEELGIGRPSTYAPTLDTLQSRGYVVKENGRYALTDLGRLITDLLLQNFPNVLDYEFTAKMEADLDRVEAGDADWRGLLREFYGPFKAVLDAADKLIAEQKDSIEQPTDIVCEKCGAKMIVKWGRHGRFLACPSYPACQNTKSLKETSDGSIEAETEAAEGENCPACGSVMNVRVGRFGKFLACARYPECKTTKPISLKIPCPLGCGGEVVARRARRGNMFYGCTRYPECKFVSWNKPVARACPACESPFLVEKYTKTLGPHVACPRRECDYKEPTAPSTAPTAPEPPLPGA